MSHLPRYAALWILQGVQKLTRRQKLSVDNWFSFSCCCHRICIFWCLDSLSPDLEWVPESWWSICFIHMCLDVKIPLQGALGFVSMFEGTGGNGTAALLGKMQFAWVNRNCMVSTNCIMVTCSRHISFSSKTKDLAKEKNRLRVIILIFCSWFTDTTA